MQSSGSKLSGFCGLQNGVTDEFELFRALRARNPPFGFHSGPGEGQRGQLLASGVPCGM